MFEDATVISSYTRKQALEDGVLVDVTTMAQEAGFKIPLAVTSAVWFNCVAWSEQDEQSTQGGQDEQGRLWDVLCMAYLAAKTTDGDKAPFKVLVLGREATNGTPSSVDLVLHIGPGDELEPVCTIMEPNED